MRRSPDAKIAIVGCYAQLQAEALSALPGVSIVLGAKEKFNLPSYFILFKIDLAII